MWLLSEQSEELAEVLEDYLEKDDHMSIARRNLEEGRVPLSSVWEGLADELGLSGLTVPEDFDGGGGTLVDGAVAQFVLGKTGASVPFLSNLLTAQVLNNLPESEERNRLYEGLVAGQVVTVAPNVQREVKIIDSSEENCVLDGSIASVVDAGIADTVITLLPGSDSDEVLVVQVSLSQTSLTVSTRDSWSGTRQYAEIHMEKAAGTHIGRMSVVSLNRLQLVARAFLAAERLGGAFATLDMAVEYAKTRTQFDRLIGAFQGVKHPLANLFVQLHMAQAQLQRALGDLSSMQESTTESTLMASVLCEQAFKTASALNIDVHGGMGYTWEHESHIFFRQAHSNSELIGGATDDLQALQEILKVGR